MAVECCRPVPRSAVLNELEDEVNWPKFLEIVHRHRIAGLVRQALKKLPAPEAELQAILKLSKTNAAANLVAAAASAHISMCLDRAGLKHVFIKGIALSALAYGNPFIKMSADIDLLVGIQDIPAAGRKLVSAGYTLAQPASLSMDRLAEWHALHKETLWTRHKDGVLLDLHSRLADSADLLPIEELPPAQLVKILPGIELPTLGNDFLHVYLAVHGASSCWFRLKWIADFAALTSESDPESLLRTAARFGVPGPMAQALLLDDLIFGPKLSSDLRINLSRKWSNQVSLRLCVHAIMGGEPTRRRLGTLPIHINQLLMKSGPIFIVKDALRQFRSALHYRLAG